MNTTETPSARELFASDYLLIADNDNTAYNLLNKLAKVANTVTLSDTMREHYEDLCARVFDLMDPKQFSEFERGLIMQLLAGWGSDAFDTIARELVARD